MQALNQMIDLHATVMEAQNRVPTRVLGLLMVVANIVVGTVGYAFGLARRRQLLGTMMLAVLVSAIVVVTLDLDRPQGGRIRVNLDALIHLREGMGGSVQ
jgi:hypothetical protein